jgi:hypothetical protein
MKHGIRGSVLTWIAVLGILLLLFLVMASFVLRALSMAANPFGGGWP